MSNYRRFVTYFYDYSGGARGAICGFGKVEYSVRSRIHLTIKARRSGREECIVYGMSREQEPDQMLGQFMLNFGKGNFLWEWNGKEKAADDFVRNMAGIVLCLKQSGTVLCATRWDGVEFSPDRFLPDAVVDRKLEENPKENSETKEILDGVPEHVSHKETKEPVEIVLKEDSEESFERIPEPIQEVIVEERENSNQVIVKERENSNQVIVKETENQNEVSKETITIEEVPTKVTEKDLETMAQQQPMEMEEQQASQLLDEFFTKQGKFVEDPLELAAASANVVVVQPEYLEKKNSKEAFLVWEQLSRQYAKFMPFLPSCKIQCLRIRLGDLGRLPKENKRLANNNFLLHGYYRCHYIVLAKQEAENGTEYYVGIPGIYQDREAKLAENFGFSVFAPYKGGNVTPGKCGLWMTPLKLDGECG